MIIMGRGGASMDIEPITGNHISVAFTVSTPVEGELATVELDQVSVRQLRDVCITLLDDELERLS